MQEREEFIRNWEVLKPLMLAKWNKLTEKNLKGLQPDFNDIVDVIHSKYKDYPRETIVQELENLMQQIKNPW